MEPVFQSTRPRGARPLLGGKALKQAHVSIHAPAWGATRYGDKIFRRTVVSIHAPAWGATAQRSREAPVVLVSIHAPAWGATSPASPLSRPTRCFNPRARVGRDTGTAHSAGTAVMFQSTRPRGARHEASNSFKSAFRFQSTRPRGARLVADAVDLGGRAVSIHAPARGATRVDTLKSLELTVSIHAPARGATSRAPCGRRCSACFNPRARVGRDAWALTCPAIKELFQSTRPRGARQKN